MAADTGRRRAASGFTRRRPLARLTDALEPMLSREAIKVVVEP